jgi:Tol biopolymer transport system component
MRRLFIPALILVAGGCDQRPSGILEPGDSSLAVANLGSWSAAVALSELNTGGGVTEGCPFISKSGDVLYFASNRFDSYGGLDLYVSHWDAASSSWGAPQNLGAGVNSELNDQCPLILNGGKELIFVSARVGGAGGLDLWSMTRHDHRDDFGWSAPVNLSSLNSTSNDFGPTAYESNRGETVLYFNSNRGGLGDHDIYVSTRSRGGVYSAPEPVSELNTSVEDQFPVVSKDGLEMFFASDRTGTLGGMDLWHSTRSSTSHPWGTPSNLGPAVNSASAEGRGSLSWDNKTFYFHSNRDGSVDLFRTTRTRVTGPKK